MSSNKKASVNISINNQPFIGVESRHGDNRDIQIIHSIDGANWVEYRSNNGPISQNNNWYHNHVEEFYRQLCTAIAQEYINNNNVWVNSVTTTINGYEYTYNLT